ncbi:uncharacterized protein LOC110095602 [Dendrobium catenatum]|uniref:uncharacterized protein LOC110095602 n=1 Tax=Dendrobium catenatum TaxID=906689 RepID=UPI0009F3BC78|nr:uncharacterized protein LOC110095602 [Dendrobium catenatum]
MSDFRSGGKGMPSNEPSRTAQRSLRSFSQPASSVLCFRSNCCNFRSDSRERRRSGVGHQQRNRRSLPKGENYFTASELPVAAHDQNGVASDSYRRERRRSSEVAQLRRSRRSARKEDRWLPSQRVSSLLASDQTIVTSVLSRREQGERERSSARESSERDVRAEILSFSFLF